MSESLTVEWLNENELRAYPLRTAANRYIGPKDIGQYVVDASFVFAELPIPVVLTEISNTHKTITVSAQVFAFTIPSPFPEYVYSRSVEGSLLVVKPSIFTLGDVTGLAIPFEDSVSSEFSMGWLGVSSLTIL